MSRPIVVLLSGGLDSATALAVAKRDGFTPHALTFDYGQRHRIEIESAQAVAQAIGVASHTLFQLDLRQFGGSALTEEIDVPRHRTESQIGTGVPITYVPARNIVFLSIAVAMAESRNCSDVSIGVNALDYSGYPDCRPEFIEAFARAATLATRIGTDGGRGITLHTPLAGCSKAQIVQLAHELSVPLARTISCYDPEPTGRVCGECDACVLRKRGFEQANLTDPASLIVGGSDL